MEKIKALIIDDEYQARKGIRTLLACEHDIEVIGESTNGRQAILDIEHLLPDIVFLDIQMPDKNGFEVLASINIEKMPALIFITAYDNYALKAFEFSALDYLLKPFSDERFYTAVAKAKEHHEQKNAHDFNMRVMSLIENYRRESPQEDLISSSKSTASLKRFFVKSNDEIHFIPVKEVDWLEAVGYYTKIHAGKKTHLLRGNLGSIEKQLDPKKFTRIHRSAVVNLSRIQSMKNLFHGDCLIVLQNGTGLKVSSSHRRKLEELLERLA